MKIKRIAAAFVFCLVLFIPSVLLAQNSPKDLLQATIAKMKATGDAGPMMEIVHWETAFKNLDPNTKARMNVKSADGFRRYLTSMTKDPVGFFRREMQRQMKSVPPDQLPMMEQQMATMEQMMKEAQERQKRELAGSSYKILGEQVSGNTATVTILTSYQGQTKEDQVQMIKVGEKWYLPGTESLAASENKTAGPAMK